MTLTLEEVEHIAQLARLELSLAEKERYRQQLSAILEYAARLQAVDTRDIEPDSGSPAASELRAVTPLRPDQPEAGLSTAALLRNAPEAEQNQFKVPPVLE